MRMYFSVKMQNTGILTLRQMSRYFYTGNVNQNISKQGKVISKLINRNQSKRDSIEHIINTASYGMPKKQLSVHTKRRMNVLNKVFMEHITDMMSTGEIEPDILNRDIEISHVKVTPDFKLINVYWLDNCIKESDTEQLLQKCAFQLRHQLSQLRVIGNVPPIQFVKCRGLGTLKELEQKLATLDFGEDHVPKVYPHAIHHTVTALQSCSNVEEQPNKELNTSKDAFSVTVPVMRHDVFGLDHYRIMSKIKASLNKARKTHKVLTTNVQLDAQNVPSFLTESEQQHKFLKFLSERRKEQKRKNKKKCSDVDNIINYVEEQNYDDNDDYEIENDYDELADQEHDDFEKSMDEEFKNIR